MKVRTDGQPRGIIWLHLGALRFWECRSRVGSRGLGSGRRRSPSPYRRRGSPIYGYDRRSYSPRGRRSPRRRSITPPHGRIYSRSPPYRHSRRYSPYATGV
ncbi:hypothetical protein RIF29_41327 [Crotalaria pallida]|uniref:Uncharacterized protein n=1 Tax=Crotalaria pallida TaxID=3830 RepID=A0AAN9E569_CROPI